MYEISIDGNYMAVKDAVNRVRLFVAPQTQCYYLENTNSFQVVHSINKKVWTISKRDLANQEYNDGRGGIFDEVTMLSFLQLNTGL